MITRREILQSSAVASSIGIGALSNSTTVTATGASFGDGVNLQPAYFCNGDQNLGWDLMDDYSDIQSVRIEIEPDAQATVSDAKRWIREANDHGYHVVASYHQATQNGSANGSALSDAADWWVDNYDTLAQGGSFTVNLMNEWGDHSVTASEYASAYNDAISAVRTVYSDTIVCDIPGWGQETHVAADASSDIVDDDIIFSAHVYPGAWNSVSGDWLSTSDLDYLNDAGRPCMLGEFGSGGSGSANWSGLVNHAKSLGWPVLGWAWNGDGSSDPMNMSSPYWGDSCSASSYSTTSYFDTVYDKLG